MSSRGCLSDFCGAGRSETLAHNCMASRHVTSGSAGPFPGKAADDSSWACALQRRSAAIACRSGSRLPTSGEPSARRSLHQHVSSFGTCCFASTHGALLHEWPLSLVVSPVPPSRPSRSGTPALTRPLRCRVMHMRYFAIAYVRSLKAKQLHASAAVHEHKQTCDVCHVCRLTRKNRTHEG